MGRIQAILFDLGNVIVPLDTRRGFEAMEAHSPYEASGIRARMTSTDLVTRLESGAIGADEFYRELCRLLDLKIDFATFREIWSAIFLPHTLVPESLLEGLRARYRLVLLSNTNSIHFEMIRERYPLLRHFEHFVLSHEVGAMKPSPKIYRAAVSKAGCRASECFFTDDVPAYVEGAQREGIDAVQFQGLEKLERDLRERGIDW